MGTGTGTRDGGRDGVLWVTEAEEEGVVMCGDEVGGKEEEDQDERNKAWHWQSWDKLY